MYNECPKCVETLDNTRPVLLQALESLGADTEPLKHADLFMIAIALLGRIKRFKESTRVDNPLQARLNCSESHSNELSAFAPTPEPSETKPPLESMLGPLHGLDCKADESLLSKTIEHLAEQPNRADTRLPLRWFRELRDRRAKDATYRAWILDQLATDVMAATIEAEQLEPGTQAYREAWLRVGSAENAIARELPPTDLEGQIARRGAVRAAIKAGNEQAAAWLARTYIGECLHRGSVAAAEELERQLREVLESTRVDCPSKPVEAGSEQKPTQEPSEGKAP